MRGVTGSSSRGTIKLQPALGREQSKSQVKALLNQKNTEVSLVRFETGFEEGEIWNSLEIRSIGRH